jgi:hypothetical protein
MTDRARRHALALVLAALAAAPAGAEGLPAALACTFGEGSTLTYAQGAFSASRARPLAFDIGEIDLEAQNAVLLTAAGRGRLRVVRAVNANHFLEVVNEGFLNITTVYDLDPQRKRYPAVHSRHFGLLGEPVVAQYHGFCAPK